MLYVTNKDKPGFIGRLGTLLGDEKVNIANFNLGRAAPGEDAISLVEVDGPIRTPCSTRSVRSMASSRPSGWRSSQVGGHSRRQCGRPPPLRGRSDFPGLRQQTGLGNPGERFAAA